MPDRLQWGIRTTGENFPNIYLVGTAQKKVLLSDPLQGKACLANKSFLFGHLLCSFQYDPIDGKNSTEPQKNTQKHVFLGLTKNTEKHFYHLGYRG